MNLSFQVKVHYTRLRFSVSHLYWYKNALTNIDARELSYLFSTMGPAKGFRRYTLLSSVQLMEAHQLQEEMDRAEKDEEELAEVGRQIEEDIRKRPALGEPWASYQIHKTMCRECWGRFPRHRLKRKPIFSYPSMHHCTYVTAIWQEAHGLLVR